jgi:hypothetical protein
LSSVNKLFDVTNTRSGTLDVASLLIEVQKGQGTTRDISMEVSIPDSLWLEQSQTDNSRALASSGPDSSTMPLNDSYQAKGPRLERLEKLERLERPERLKRSPTETRKYQKQGWIDHEQKYQKQGWIDHKLTTPEEKDILQSSSKYIAIVFLMASVGLVFLQ